MRDLLQKALDTFKLLEQQPDYELVSFNVMDQVEQVVMELEQHLNSNPEEHTCKNLENALLQSTKGC